MRPILDIAINDLRVIFRERGIWLNIIVIPIIIAYLVGFANGAGAGTAPTEPAVLVDVSGVGTVLREEARLLALARAANPNLVFCPMDNDDADRCRLEGRMLDRGLARDRLEAQISLAWLIFPSAFSVGLAAGETVTLDYRSNEDALAPTFILEAVRAAANELGAIYAAERVGLAVADETPGLTFSDEFDRLAFGITIRENAAAQWAQNPIAVDFQRSTFDPNQRIEQGGGGFSQSVPGMATMYVMFAVFPAASAFILERKQWTLQRLTTMPLTRAQILGGKLLARFLLGMLQYAIMFAFGYLIGVRYGGAPLALILLMVLFVACITALTLALTTLLRTDMQAQGVTLFLALVMAPLGGAWWPLEIVPGFMQAAARITPVAWVMDGYRTLIFEQGALVDVLPSLAVLAGMTVVFFAFGVSRYRME